MNEDDALRRATTRSTITAGWPSGGPPLPPPTLPGLGADKVAAMDQQMAATGQVSAQTHQLVIGTMNKALRQLIADTGRTPAAGGHSALVAQLRAILFPRK